MPITKEQSDVINHGNGNILVSASAGSGKTHTMIERVIRLITEENVNVDEILCVTFTEAAALEMKERLKNALITKIEKTNDSRLKVQLGEISTADISTMHAFCGRLIRSYFFAVGVAPDYKILDESDAKVIKQRSIEKTFKEFYESGEEWFYTLVDRHAVSRADAKLKETVLNAYAFCNSEADTEYLMDKSLEAYTEKGFSLLYSEYKREFDKRLKKLKEQVQVSLAVFRSAKLVKGTAFAESLLADIEFMLSTNDFYKLKTFEDYKLALDFERKIDEIVKEHKDIVSSVRDSLKKLCKKYLKCVGSDYHSDYSDFMKNKEHTEWFLRVLKRFSTVYAEEKAEENALDFNDLEHYALKALADEEIRDVVRKKYKYIFVDEYQDTNGVQESIIERIENDNVFMVGDVKQSIYSFRGCRSEFFTHKDQLMSARGETVVRLNTNFRSAKNVVDGVNKIFSFCMTDDVYGENYAGRSELIYGNTFGEDATGGMEIHYLHKEDTAVKEEEIPRIYDLLEEKTQESINNATTTASLLTKIINGELEKQIYDAKLKKFRPATYGDVAILTRSKDSDYVRDLISGLARRGVPVVSDTQVNVLNYPEIKMMVNALSLIDCFSQDVPLASTLKSPIGKLNDEELMDISMAFRNENKRGNFYEAYHFYLENGQSPLKEKLIAFEKYFNEIRFISDFIGANGVLQKLINDNNIKGCLLASTGGVEKTQRLERFVSASVVAGKRLTVKEFLNRINTCPEAFGLSLFSSENTVKAMTVHASKGLEFPIVIVCGLERGFNDDDDYKEIMFDRKYGFAVKTYDDQTRVKRETVLRGLIRENLYVERIKEELRLFYVATTRATYSLHLVYCAKEDKRKEEFESANCFMDFLPSYLPVTEHYADELSMANVTLGARKVLIGKADDNTVKKMQSNFDYKYEFLQDTLLPLKHTVTAAIKEERQDYYLVHVLFDDDAPDAERGTIAHKFLEYFDFYSDFDVLRQSEKMISDGVLTQEELSKINLQRIENALKSGVFDGFKKAVLYREKSFLVAICGNKVTNVDSQEKVLLQGVIDLLAITENGAEIVDYKYSSLDKDSLKTKYKKQLELYAYAVENALGIKVNRTSLVNLFTGETVKIYSDKM